MSGREVAGGRVPPGAVFVQRFHDDPVDGRREELEASPRLGSPVAGDGLQLVVPRADAQRRPRRLLLGG